MKKLLLILSIVLAAGEVFATFDQAWDAIESKDTQFVCSNLRQLKAKGIEPNNENAFLIIVTGMGIKELHFRFSKYFEEGFLLERVIKRKYNLPIYEQIGEEGWRDDIDRNEYNSDGFKFVFYTDADGGDATGPNEEILDGVLNFKTKVWYRAANGETKGLLMSCGLPNAKERYKKTGNFLGIMASQYP